MDQVIKIAENNPDLKTALLAVAAKKDGKSISNVRLHRWLCSHNDTVLHGLRLRSSGIEDGSVKWTLVADE
jgi:hypothetical protein